MIEYAPNDPAQPPPKLYVPVTEAHLVSKYVGTGKARPPLNTLGGNRWAKAKAHAERAVRDVAEEQLQRVARRLGDRFVRVGGLRAVRRHSGQPEATRAVGGKRGRPGPDAV